MNALKNKRAPGRVCFLQVGASGLFFVGPRLEARVYGREARAYSSSSITTGIPMNLRVCTL